MKIRVSILAAVLTCAFCAASEATPIQWTNGTGGNNHFYDLVAPPAGITWTDARSAAAASTFLGLTGHLVTIGNQGEWDFVTTNFPRDWTWIGLTDEVQEGNFRWVTGEPLTFTRWITGEPNNSGGIENYVFYQHSSQLNGAIGWNDFPNWTNVFTAALPIGYVVEYEPVPEPSSVVLAAFGVSGLVAGGWRRRTR